MATKTSTVSFGVFTNSRAYVGGPQALRQAPRRCERRSASWRTPPSGSVLSIARPVAVYTDGWHMPSQEAKNGGRPRDSGRGGTVGRLGSVCHRRLQNVEAQCPPLGARPEPAAISGGSARTSIAVLCAQSQAKKPAISAQNNTAIQGFFMAP